MIDKPKNGAVNIRTFTAVLGGILLIAIAVTTALGGRVSANQESTRMNEVSIKGVETNIENIKDDIGEIKKNVDYIKSVFDK